MAEIVRRRSWGGVLPLGRHVSISGSRSIHAPSVRIAPSSFQEEQNARHHKQFKLEQALKLNEHTEQKDLLIQYRDNTGSYAEITVDSLQLAQFVHLLLNNENLRDVIDTIGEK